MKPVRPDRLRDVVDAVLEALDEGLDGPALAARAMLSPFHIDCNDSVTAASCKCNPAVLPLCQARVEPTRKMRSQIALVHEDEDVREALCRALRAAGHVVEVLIEPAPWLLVGAGLPELILLSWTAQLPVRELVRELHAIDRRVALLVTHPLFREAVTMLEHGADECIAMPPLIEEEVVARVAACMRRSPGRTAPARLSAGPMVLDKAMHALYVDSHEVDLSPAEFRLLAFLLDNPGRVFSRHQLLRGAWSKFSGVNERTVDVHVRRLRRALEPFGCERMIHTVRGFGYRLALPSRADAAADPDPVADADADAPAARCG